MKDGKELTDYFYFENSFTGDLPSIINNQPCISSSLAMEPTTLITLRYADLNNLSKKYPNIDHLLRVSTEQSFITFYRKSVSFILQSPKVRYHELVTHYPDILQRVPQYHIASYLGITPQHLSRLRQQP